MILNSLIWSVEVVSPKIIQRGCDAPTHNNEQNFEVLNVIGYIVDRGKSSATGGFNQNTVVVQKAQTGRHRLCVC